MHAGSGSGSMMPSADGGRGAELASGVPGMGPCATLPGSCLLAGRRMQYMCVPCADRVPARTGPVPTSSGCAIGCIVIISDAYMICKGGARPGVHQRPVQAQACCKQATLTGTEQVLEGVTMAHLLPHAIGTSRQPPALPPAPSGILHQTMPLTTPASPGGTRAYGPICLQSHAL